MMGIERTLLFLALALLAEIAGTLGGFGSSVFFVPIFFVWVLSLVSRKKNARADGDSAASPQASNGGVTS